MTELGAKTRRVLRPRTAGNGVCDARLPCFSVHSLPHLLFSPRFDEQPCQRCGIDDILGVLSPESTLFLSNLRNPSLDTATVYA